MNHNDFLFQISYSFHVPFRFVWKRKFFWPSHSVMTVYWNTANAEPGQYRISCNGIARSIFGKIQEYSGVTEPFELV